MQDIKFTQNWNNKLQCNYFTTIRSFNPSKYQLYTKFNVLLKRGNNWEKIGTVEVVNIRNLRAIDLQANECYCDTGYNKEQTLNIFQKMYSRRSQTYVRTAQMSIITLKQVTPKKETETPLF